MRLFARLLAAATTTALVAIAATAASNPGNVTSFPTVAKVQAAGGPQYPNIFVVGYGPALNGANFTWNDTCPSASPGVAHITVTGLAGCYVQAMPPFNSGATTVGNIATFSTATGSAIQDSGVSASNVLTRLGLGAGVETALSKPSAGTDSLLTAVTPQEFGAICDGAAHTGNDAAIQAMFDAAYGTWDSPHGTNVALNREIHFPTGVCEVSVGPRARKVRGAKITGAGKLSSGLKVTGGGDGIYFDALQYSQLSDFSITLTQATGTGLNLASTGTAGFNEQQVTVSNMSIQGGQDGVAIGIGNYQADTNTFVNNFIGGQARYGVSIWNYNALENNFFGGDFQYIQNSCAYVYRGAAKFFGTGFQQCGYTSGYDVEQHGSANDVIVTSGVRTENLNFYKQGVGSGPAVIHGVYQVNANPGIFAYAQYGGMSIDGCYSQNGQVLLSRYSTVEISNCTFGRSDWVTTDGNDIDTVAHVVNVVVGTKTYLDTYFTKMVAGSTALIQVNAPQSLYVPIPAGSASVTITIPSNAWVVDVSLVIKTGGTGTISVGDTSSATDYFSAQSLAASAVSPTFTSTVAGVYYSAGTTITATTATSSGVTGFVRVEYRNQVF